MGIIRKWLSSKNVFYNVKKSLILCDIFSFIEQKKNNKFYLVFFSYFKFNVETWKKVKYLVRNKCFESKSNECSKGKVESRPWVLRRVSNREVSRG